MKNMLFVTALLLGGAAFAQTWQYGTLIVLQQVAWLAPGEDITGAANLPALADDLPGATPDTTGTLAVILNKLGREGWDLVAIDNHGVYVFRRPSAPAGPSAAAPPSP